MSGIELGKKVPGGPFQIEAKSARCWCKVCRAGSRELLWVLLCVVVRFCPYCNLNHDMGTRTAAIYVQSPTSQSWQEAGSVPLRDCLLRVAYMVSWLLCRPECFTDPSSGWGEHRSRMPRNTMARAHLARPKRAKNLGLKPAHGVSGGSGSCGLDSTLTMD